MEKISLSITGMHCAGCAGNVERKLNQLAGVESATVNLALEKVLVNYDPKKLQRENLVQAVRNAGYDVRQNEIRTVLRITGMHCSGCTNTVENALTKLPGVSSAYVAIATEKAVITHAPEAVSGAALIQAIQNAGYDATPESAESANTFLDDQEKRIQKYRKLMTIGWAITGPIMLLMLAHMMFGFMLPASNWIFLIAAAPVVFWVGADTHKSSFNVLRHGGTNMDVLITLGAFAAFATGVGALFFPVASYAAVAAMIICFQVTGRYLEFQAKGKTSQAIQKLIKLEAKTARVIENSDEKEISMQALKPGDIMLIKPGEKIPTDGVVVKGQSSVDESIATGESMPVGKNPDDEVLGATINKEGVLQVRATRVGKDTFLAQVIKLVEECQTTKVPIQEFADKVTAIFVPVIILLAALTFAAWLVFDEFFLNVVKFGSQFLPWVAFDLSPVSLAVFAAVAVLVIACPCALGLATPTALMVGTGIGAEMGVLFRQGAAIQTLQSIDTVVLDKTGTITKGAPEVTDVLPVNGFSKDELMQYAGAAERSSEHPLAKAIVVKTKEDSIKAAEVTSFEAVIGSGVKCKLSGKALHVGHSRWFKELGIHLDGFANKIKVLETQGKTVMLVAVDLKLAGIIAVSDTLRDDSISALKAMKKLGLKTVMLTGDNQKTAEAVAESVAVDSFFAEVLPDQKVEVIKKLQQEGKIVLMVGDGINDAPALTQADVGMAIGTGADVAIESADVTLVKGDLTGVLKAFGLSRAIFTKIKQNLFWAFFYNVIMIPVAIMGLLHPALAEVAMAASSVNVVANSLRLKKIKI